MLHCRHSQNCVKLALESSLIRRYDYVNRGAETAETSLETEMKHPLKSSANESRPGCPSQVTGVTRGEGRLACGLCLPGADRRLGSSAHRRRRF